jgi:hypothetical protein
LGGRKCSFSSALQLRSETAAPNRLFGYMDRPPGQLLSAGKRYCTLALYRRDLCVTRLFPLQRAIKAGGDSRFDEVKHQTGTFTAFWMAQGLSADPFFLRVLTAL